VASLALYAFLFAVLAPCLGLEAALADSGKKAKTDNFHSIGQPTAEEQYYVELINRARANPEAEGVRLAQSTDPDVVSSYKAFDVDLSKMKAEFGTLSAMPPLAINAKLTSAARDHSTDMFKNQFQGHTGSDNSGIGDRAKKAGYDWQYISENVYSYADSVWHGHAGFQVDWGEGDGGMQPTRGHRVNIHHGSPKEIGVGVVLGRNGDVGPQVVTQNFGRSKSNTAYITGVAYYDVDKDGFYSPGEGVGNVTVSVSGVSLRALTSNSGGYAVPVPATKATRKVEFQGGGINFSTNATIAGGKNVKVDLKREYKAPVPKGPSSMALGSTGSFSFTPLPGASAHDWSWISETPAPTDTAENLSRGKTESAGQYSMISKAVKNSGAASYRFAHPVLNRSETFTYSKFFLPGKNASISFRSRLGWASQTQFAKIQASKDEGKTWQDIYSQAGSGSNGETSFQQRTASLAAFEGKSVMIRLNYTMKSGTTAFYQTSNDTGWFVDDLVFIKTGELSTPKIQRVSGKKISFVPRSSGSFHLAIRPVFPGGAWSFGPLAKVTVKK